MGFILILTPTATNGWPAVIGGYETREQATAAGREATMAHLTQDAFEDAGYGFGDHLTNEQRLEWSAWKTRAYTAYTVIPGNAA